MSIFKGNHEACIVLATPISLVGLAASTSAFYIEGWFEIIFPVWCAFMVSSLWTMGLFCDVVSNFNERNKENE